MICVIYKAFVDLNTDMSDDVVNSISTSVVQMPLTTVLRQWVNENSITHTAVKSLIISILRIQIQPTLTIILMMKIICQLNL